MEIKAGVTVDDAKSTYIPLSSTPSFFPDQALRAGLLRNFERRRSDSSSNAIIEAMIAREIEKRRIREEIITAGAEFLRRRELEEEVMREMMFETTRRPPAERLLLADSPLPSFGSVIRGPFLEERLGLAGLVDGGVSLLNRTDGGGAFPLQRQPEPTTSGIAVKPVINLRKGQPVPLDEPANSSSAGMKRKCEAASPIIVCSDGGRASVSKSKKKSKKEWSCDLCEVKATCEEGLNDHLNGKKHRAREKALLLVKKDTKTVSNNSGVEDSDHFPFELPTATATTTATATATATDTGFKSENNSNSKFWCTMCNFGAANLGLMTAHRMGKMHSNLLREKGGGVVAINTMPNNAQYVGVASTKGNEGKGGNAVHGQEDTVGLPVPVVDMI